MRFCDAAEIILRQHEQVSLGQEDQALLTEIARRLRLPRPDDTRTRG